jgi:hypothetical protein
MNGYRTDNGGRSESSERKSVLDQARADFARRHADDGKEGPPKGARVRPGYLPGGNAKPRDPGGPLFADDEFFTERG